MNKKKVQKTGIVTRLKAIKEALKKDTPGFKPQRHKGKTLVCSVRG